MKTFYATFGVLYLLITCFTSVNGAQTPLRNGYFKERCISVDGIRFDVLIDPNTFAGKNIVLLVVLLWLQVIVVNLNMTYWNWFSKPGMECGVQWIFDRNPNDQTQFTLLGNLTNGFCIQGDSDGQSPSVFFFCFEWYLPTVNFFFINRPSCPRY